MGESEICKRQTICKTQDCHTPRLDVQLHSGLEVLVHFSQYSRLLNVQYSGSQTALLALIITCNGY